MAKGKIVLLNGASSAGKTSIARALQNLMEEPYLYVSLDAFFAMLPRRYFGIHAPETDVSAQGFNWLPDHDSHGDYHRLVSGTYGDHLMMDIMHQTIAVIASTGDHVVVDDVLLEHTWLLDYLRVLRNFEVCFVQVYCPFEVLEEREQARGDRALGLARGQYERVHAHGIYDLTVDTAQLSPEEAAEQIRRALEYKPTAFDQLRENLLDGDGS